MGYIDDFFMHPSTQERYHFHEDSRRAYRFCLESLDLFRGKYGGMDFVNFSLLAHELLINERQYFGNSPEECKERSALRTVALIQFLEEKRQLERLVHNS